MAEAAVQIDRPRGGLIGSQFPWPVLMIVSLPESWLTV